MPEATQVIRFDENRNAFQLGLSEVYKNTLKVTPQSYKEWLHEENADQFFKTDWAVSGLGVMQEKTIGGRFATDKAYYGPTKTYTMKTYGLSLVVQYEVFRWDLYSIFKPISKELAKSAMTRYDLVAYALLNNAFSTSDSAYTDYRGEALCAVSHTRLDGGTWKNRPTTDIGLSQTALQVATTDLRKTTNDRGQFVQLTPKRLVTTVENEWLARTLLKSVYNPENANMQVNNAASYNLQQTTTPYITTSTFWFVMCDKDTYQIQMALGDMPDLREDSEPGTRNAIFTSYASFRLEVHEGKGVYGSSGV